MRFFVTICFILFCSKVCDAQSNSLGSVTDKKVSNKIKDLRSIEVDTIINYTTECNDGMALVEDTGCKAQDIQYLLWSDHGVQFMQRFDECKNYKPINTDRLFLDLISRNYLKIKREKIKPPQFMALYNGKKELVTEMVDHSCQWIFKISLGKQAILKSIDNHDLITEYIYDDKQKKKNLNYQSNQRSTLKQLTVEIDKLVKNYNH